jgi:chorismate mutase-like protein
MSSPPSLDKLRREIDALDQQIHDLLMRRAGVSDQVRWVKSNDGGAANGINLRPGREAKILRRLVSRHNGGFPKPSIIRIWREILAGSTQMQGPFSMAVLASDPQRACVNLARDHFGSYTPMTTHQSVRRVIERVMCGDAKVGILPIPRHDDTDPWWPHLMSGDTAAPRIIARLPFGGPENLIEPDQGALVISCLKPDDTGEDRSQLCIDAAEPISLARLGPALKKGKLELTFFARWENPQVRESCLHFVEVAGYVTASDQHLVKALRNLEQPVNRTIMVGAYAVPLSKQALKISRKGGRDD